MLNVINLILGGAPLIVQGVLPEQAAGGSILIILVISRVVE